MTVLFLATKDTAWDSVYCCHFEREGFDDVKENGELPVQGKITPKIRRRDSKAIRPLRLKSEICVCAVEDWRGDKG